MKSKFLEVFKEALSIEEQNVQLADEFRLYDEWDSLAQLSLIAALDEEFDVTIEGDAFEKIVTVEDLLKFIQQKTSK